MSLRLFPRKSSHTTDHGKSKGVKSNTIHTSTPTLSLSLTPSLISTLPPEMVSQDVIKESKRTDRKSKSSNQPTIIQTTKVNTIRKNAPKRTSSLHPATSASNPDVLFLNEMESALDQVWKEFCESDTSKVNPIILR
jgi:hypothetical protein